jgi:hypothetical protein
MSPQRQAKSWLWALLMLGGASGWAAGCSLGHNPDLPDFAAGDGDGDDGSTTGLPDGGDGDGDQPGAGGAPDGGGSHGGGLGGGGAGGAGGLNQAEETP